MADNNQKLDADQVRAGQSEDREMDHSEDDSNSVSGSVDDDSEQRDSDSGRENATDQSSSQQRENDTDSGQYRQVARRMFAREFNDGTYTFKESSEERAPVYTLLPTGERANRVFVVGTLTETEDIGSDSEYWQGRVVDPTGTFFIYAGQYQPGAASVLRETEPPAYVAVVGKPRTYETDDGTVNVSLRPESITIVDTGTRDRWVVETAMRTIERVEAFTDGTEYVRMADEQYGRAVEEYKHDALNALEELDEEGTDGSST
jgi:RPA family protein